MQVDLSLTRNACPDDSSQAAVGSNSPCCAHEASPGIVPHSGRSLSATLRKYPVASSCKQVPTVAEDRLPPCSRTARLPRRASSVRARHRPFLLLWQVEKTMTDVVGWATKKTSDGQSQSLWCYFLRKKIGLAPAYLAKDRTHLWRDQPATGRGSKEFQFPLGLESTSCSNHTHPRNWLFCIPIQVGPATEYARQSTPTGRVM